MPADKADTFDPVHNIANPNDELLVFPGKLYLSESFLSFRSHIDPRNCTFVIALVTIRKVERLPSQSHIFALSIHLYHGLNIIITFVGLRSDAKDFCNLLQDTLKSSLSLIQNSKLFIDSFYSEYLIHKISASHDTSLPSVLQPPAGLGKLFGYPGNPNKLHDKPKLQSWYDLLKQTAATFPSSASNSFSSSSFSDCQTNSAARSGNFLVVQPTFECRTRISTLIF